MPTLSTHHFGEFFEDSGVAGHFVYDEMSQAVPFCILLCLLVGLSKASQKEAPVPRKCCRPPLFQITNTDLRSYGAEELVSFKTHVYIIFKVPLRNKLFFSITKTKDSIFLYSLFNGGVSNLFSPKCYLNI